MREVVLALFDNHQPGRLMNRIEAESFGDEYHNAKLACAVPMNDTDSKYVLIEIVKVSRVEVTPERPAPRGRVVAFCEPYRTEQRRL